MAKPYVARGKPVDVFVRVRNTGNVPYNFCVGLSFRKPDGSWYDIPTKKVNIAMGQTATVQFRWTIPKDAPKGYYDVFTSVWKVCPPTAEANRLDSYNLQDHFKVV